MEKTQIKEEETKKEEIKENECEKALADTILDLKKQLDEANKKREEADARAVELTKILRNTGTQKQEPKKEEKTLKQLVEDLF